MASVSRCATLASQLEEAAAAAASASRAADSERRMADAERAAADQERRTAAGLRRELAAAVSNGAHSHDDDDAVIGRLTRQLRDQASQLHAAQIEVASMRRAAEDAPRAALAASEAALCVAERARDAAVAAAREAASAQLGPQKLPFRPTDGVTLPRMVGERDSHALDTHYGSDTLPMEEPALPAMTPGASAAQSERQVQINALSGASNPAPVAGGLAVAY